MVKHGEPPAIPAKEMPRQNFAELEEGDEPGCHGAPPCCTEHGQASGVVFSREESLAKNAQGCSVSHGHDGGLMQEPNGCIRNRGLDEHGRVDFGHSLQLVLFSRQWGLAESLVALADHQLMLDYGLSVSLDAIWFLRTKQDLEGLNRLIAKIVALGAKDFARAVLRTSLLAPCVVACQSKGFSGLPIPTLMDDAGAALAAAPTTTPPPPPPPSAAQLPSNASPHADTPASDATPAKTPNLSDTPAPGDPDTPFSDADASAVAPASSDAAADAAEDDGKHITLAPPAQPSKKSKKKSSGSVWTRPASRKGKKKAKQPAHPPAGANGSRRPKPSCGEDEFFLTPAPRLAAERNDDAPALPVLLSRVFKSEKIELSEDRLTAGSTKGFRMIRATRGVAAGAWYFEVKVLHLGHSGHTRLGWATNSADLQTPVGCDGFGFGYRDIDGSKVHKAWRHEYAGEGYGEGDVLGFYISLPDGEQYEPKQPDLVHYKGMPFRVEVLKDEQKMPDPVPGSEVCYFKNGVCQGTAFVDIPGGRYYPAASMYTLPDQPNCEVRFNFGPDFEFFPDDLGGRPSPQPMSEVPYKAYEVNNEGPAENGIAEKANV